MVPKSLEIDGKSVEDAINNALKKLATTRDKIQVKVLCEEEKGLFGMKGAKPARIRVTLKNS